MKSIIRYVSIIIILIIPFTCFSQWTDITIDTTSFYNVIKFKNQDQGLIMGDSSIILKTIDGGNNWNNIICQVNININDFQYINDTLIYAYGSGKIIKSENSGNTWDSSFYLPASTAKVYFLNKSFGFAVGGDGIYKSTNQGMNWTSVWNYSEGLYGFGSIKDIKFLNDSNGFACGTKHISGDGIFGIILKTTDCGDNWFEVYENSPYGSDIKKLQVVEDSIIYCLTDANNLLKSIDFGNIWEEININLDSVMNPEEAIYSIFFKNKDTIYAGTYIAYFILGKNLSKRKILRTIDGGQTWIIQYLEVRNTSQEYTLNSIYFNNDTTGFAVGYKKILKTTNCGGNTNIVDTISYSINEVYSETSLDFNIYPNPANDIINIEIVNGFRKKMRLEIWNVAGEMIFRKELYNNKSIKIKKVNILNFEKGIYFVRLTNNTISITKKMIIY